MGILRVASSTVPCLPTCCPAYKDRITSGRLGNTTRPRAHWHPESVSWSISTSSHRPDNFSGKTSFLVYHLVREVVRAQSAAYFHTGYLYTFTRGIPVFGIPWKFATCPVGADVQHPPLTVSRPRLPGLFRLHRNPGLIAVVGSVDQHDQPNARRERWKQQQGTHYIPTTPNNV